MTVTLEKPCFTALAFQETDCDEPLGSKAKAWVRYEGSSWLFKFPRASGEHWAEKLAAQIAGLLELPHAQVELATLQGVPGVASRDILLRGESLVHGNELLCTLIQDYDRDKRWKQIDHSLANIWEAIELRVYFCEEAKRTFAGYLVLDAIIGNTDRHHENWAFVRDIYSRYRLGESYDHGSSLGRELQDTSRKQRCREWILNNAALPQYLQRSHGSIYWDTNDSKGPPPIQLVALALSDALYRPYFLPWLEKLGTPFLAGVHREIDAVPEGWMSPLGREFAKAMVSCSTGMLQRLL